MPFNQLLQILESVPDQRRAEGKKYKLHHILLFTILAIISGADSYRTVSTFIAVHRKGLNKAFNIKWKHAPCYSSIGNILKVQNGADVEKAFRDHAANMNKTPSSSTARTVAFDGKVLKGSFDNFKESKAKQMLSAFAVDTALVLAHIEIEEKSNEIPAMQKLLKELGIADHIVTCDAMHCQKKTFEAAAEADAHLIVQIKANQPALLERVEAACTVASPTFGAQTIDEKKRNRHETRTTTVFEALPAVKGTEWETFVVAIIRVKRVVHHYVPLTGLWQTTKETSYYLSNRSVETKPAAEAIRQHWYTENKQHYVRDVTMREDASRIRTNPGIFARMRSFGYNILRFNKRDTISQDRYAAAFGGLKWLFSLKYSIEG